jgi:dipeptidyl-peptidase-4
MHMADVQRPVSFPIEEVAATPLPGKALPTSFSFSQDGTSVFYLYGTGKHPVQQLYALDTATGATSVLVVPPGGGVQEDRLSPEEELRRQRARSLAIGLTEYSRAERSDRLLIPVTGDLYVQDRPGEPLRQILDNAGKAPALTPAFSPDGEWVAYVQDAEVSIISSAGGAPRQVTRGARGTGKTNGLAEYIAQEELARSEGFWWSPDNRLIAFEETDETHIPLYRIIHQGKDTMGEEAEEAHHYPFAGQENARVRLGAVSIEGGEPVWMDLDMGEESYLGRVFWWQDGGLGAIILNREQTTISLLRFDPGTGARSLILQETSDYWINLARRPITLLEDGRFLWLSERSGFRHLYLYQKDGSLIRRLTDGEWMVDAVRGVDERGGQVYFVGNREHPTETQLYAVSLEGGDVRRITPEPGTHQVTVDAARQQCIDVYSALDTPPRVLLRSLVDAAIRQTLDLPPDSRIAEFGLEPPELVTLTNREGVTLYGALYRPPAQYGAGPYPTIISVYGGPGPQMVANEWDLTARLDAQYLRSLGFLVFKLDNRGSARRGLAFEGAIKHRMGTVEVNDQVDGVHWLVEQGLADPARVGVTGWSYGGYMSLMCLAKAPDVFKVAVAGAPVTSWDGYDTAYTERYMGTPQSNPAGYAEGSVLTHVEQIKGKLLLVHGMLDENVHFRHTARLINALTRARKVYDLVIFPDERHMPRHRPDRVYQNEQIIGYFQRYL